MRKYQVYHGGSTSNVNLNYHVYWGGKYFYLAPQVSKVTLSAPTATATFTNSGSSATYVATITNPNNEDGLFSGSLYFKGSNVKTMSFVIPAKQTASVTYTGTLSAGNNSCNIRYARLGDAGMNLTNASSSVTLGSKALTYYPPYTITIPALQTGINSVTYKYTNASGSSASIAASSSSKTISIKGGTSITVTATASGIYRIDNNTGTSYSYSTTPSGATTMTTIYAKFATPVWGTFVTGQTVITSRVTQSYGASMQITTQRMTSSSYSTVADSRGPYTVSSGSTDSNTFSSLAPGTVYYFRAFAPASGTVRQSDYIKKAISTDSSSAT